MTFRSIRGYADVTKTLYVLAQKLYFHVTFSVSLAFHLLYTLEHNVDKLWIDLKKTNTLIPLCPRLVPVVLKQQLSEMIWAHSVYF